MSAIIILKQIVREPEIVEISIILMQQIHNYTTKNFGLYFWRKVRFYIHEMFFWETRHMNGRVSISNLRNHAKFLI